TGRPPPGFVAGPDADEQQSAGHRTGPGQRLDDPGRPGVLRVGQVGRGRVEDVSGYRGIDRQQPDLVATHRQREYSRSVPTGPETYTQHRFHLYNSLTPQWPVSGSDHHSGHGPCGLAKKELSARGGLERVPERVRLVGRHLDDEPATALQRNAHDDAAALLGDLQRTVARPRLHRRHVVSPQLAPGRSGSLDPYERRHAHPGEPSRGVPTNDFP